MNINFVSMLDERNKKIIEIKELTQQLNKIKAEYDSRREVCKTQIRHLKSKLCIIDTILCENGFEVEPDKD